MRLDKLSKDNYKIKSWTDIYPDYKVDLFKLKIHKSWSEIVESEIFITKIKDINEYFTYCLEKTNGTVNIFPFPDLVFISLNITPLDKIKVVILGQDPYPNSITVSGKLIPQAMGLSFSVPKGFIVPPSLKNIYKNLIHFKHINKEPTHGNLSFWAYQGCLLLNTSLTVQERSANGHKNSWEKITDEIIKYISANTQNTVFLLWGGPALEKLCLIDQTKHKAIISSHPSPNSCFNTLRQYKSFMNTDHFGKCNKYLTKHKKSTILWQFI